MTAEQLLPVEQADYDLADAIATALSKYSVAYSHATLTDMSTVNRSWKVHETGHGNPFEHGIWLDEFDNKKDANEFCAKLRREAAACAVSAHRLASTPTALPGAEDVALREAIARIINDGFGDPKHELPSAANCAWSKATSKADAILALIPRASDEVETDERGEAKVCIGCGTTRTVAAIRTGSATAFTCCPERKMVPVRDVWRASDEVPANPVGEVEALKAELARFRRPADRPLSTRDPIVPLPGFKPTYLLGQALLYREWCHSDLWGRPNEAELSARIAETAYHRIIELEACLAALKSADAASSQEQGASGEVAK